MEILSDLDILSSEMEFTEVPNNSTQELGYARAPSENLRRRKANTSSSCSLSSSQSSTSSSKSKRARGRPKGKPEPLNAEERRQRNAQYERERRQEMSEAMADLAKSMDLNEAIPNNEVIRKVIDYIHEKSKIPKEDINVIRARSQRLADQIAILEERLASV